MHQLRPPLTHLRIPRTRQFRTAQRSRFGQTPEGRPEREKVLRITYTDRSTNTSKTVPGGTLSGLGQGQKVKIDPVPNTTVTVTNTSENLSTTFTAAVFNPPLNRVVSKYTILSGSTVQFGTEFVRGLRHLYPRRYDCRLHGWLTNIWRGIRFPFRRQCRRDGKRGRHHIRPVRRAKLHGEPGADMGNPRFTGNFAYSG